MSSYVKLVCIMAFCLFSFSEVIDYLQIYTFITSSIVKSRGERNGACHYVIVCDFHNSHVTQKLYISFYMFFFMLFQMFRESHSIILFIFYQKRVESMALLIKLFSIHESLKERTMKNFLILSLLLYIKKKQKKAKF